MILTPLYPRIGHLLEFSPFCFWNWVFFCNCLQCGKPVIGFSSQFIK